METKFTPGPWSVTLCNEGESCWCRIISCPATKGETADWVIASGAVQKRDAHLISAAPELYAALDEAMNSGRCFENPDWWERVMTAVLKARGKQVLGAGVKIGATPDAPNSTEGEI